MQVFQNLDLLSVGVAVAGSVILGTVIFFNNRKSITSRTFWLFSIITLVWGVVNYLNYQAFQVKTSFWLLRTTIFCGVWHAFSFFQFSYVLPQPSIRYPKCYK